MREVCSGLLLFFGLTKYASFIRATAALTTFITVVVLVRVVCADSLYLVLMRALLKTRLQLGAVVVQVNVISFIGYCSDG